MAASVHPIDISIFPLDIPEAERAGLLALLSEPERARAERFKFAIHKHRYVVAHARLRQLIAARLGVAATKIEYALAEGGKPSIAQPPTGLHFSLSHSQGLGAVAFSDRNPLGVDIEEERPATDGLAARYFAPEEARAIAAAPADRVLSTFFRCWTCKEAVLKATGEGIRRGLDSFTLDLAPGRPPTIKTMDGSSDLARQWQLATFMPAPAVHGAVAVCSPQPLIEVVETRPFG